MKRTTLLLILLPFFASLSQAQMGRVLPDGVGITLRNTLQDPGQTEVTYASLFGQADDAFDESAMLSDSTSEFATALAQDTTATGLPFNINGLYDINFSKNSVEFTLLPDSSDAFWIQQFGVFPARKFDRYYFTFSQPHNITSAASNDISVALQIPSDTVIIVEISAGYNFTPGISFFISFNQAEELSNLEKAIGFNQGLQTGDPSALKWMKNTYIQHNLTVPTGKAGVAFFYTGQPIGLTIDINRSFQAGEYVFAQTTFGGSWGQISGSGTDQIIYDVWRFEDGFAVEHWDNIGDVIDDMDGTTQTDGVTTPAVDLDSTATNQALLEEMAQTLFINGDWTNVRDYFDVDNYIQHSVGAGTDGAFLASLEGQTGVSFYEDIKFVHTSGNFGLIMSQGPDITGQDTSGTYAYYDLFRIENGLIIEHWDIIELIPPQNEWVNNNGKWGDDAIKTAFSGRTEIALRNTLQDPGQPEVTYTSLFNQADDAFDEFALLSNTEIEFATALAQDTSATGLPFNINGLYEIDFTETSIDFRLLPDSSDTFWIQQFGVFPAGKFDRYYFTLSESHNISAFSSNNSSVSLRIDSDSVVVVEISEGYDFNPGISFSISLRSEDQLTNEDKAIALNAALVSGDSTALQYVSDDQYIQHNLFIPDGKAGIAGFYTGQNIGITVDLHRSFEIGDFVVNHTTFGGSWGTIGGSGSDQVVFDVWRFEEGLMVEHWDNITNVVDDMDGTSQTDGAVTPATDLDSTAANQALLEEMAEILFVGGDWTNVRSYFDIDNYIQHSVGAGTDGSFLASLEGQTGVSFYDEVKFIHTLGNFGLVMSQGPDITGQDSIGTYAYYDLFRIENGLIVEHWDVIQLIPPQSQWANSNGKWGNEALSIENLLAETGSIRLAPNPFTQSTNFEIQLEKGGLFQLQVFDITGKEVSRKLMRLNTGVNSFTYHANHLPSGLYSYRLSNNQGFISGKMIVK